MKNKIARALVSVLLIGTLVFSLAACGSGGKKEKQINLMTWGGDFVPREIINTFEEETGIKVNYKEVTSNEDTLSLLEAGPDQYDLAVVTDYMVDIMVQNDYLESWDTGKLPNFSNINPAYQSNYYDPDNHYSIPYAVSTAFLLVNPDGVAELGATPITGFDDLWQPELKQNVVLIDGSVDIMGMTLKSLGQEFNETDPVIVEEAKEKLFELRPNVVRFETNTPEDSLISGEAVVGYVYSNQAVKAIEQDSSLTHVFPKEGMPIYIDSFVMSKQAPHKEEAYQFLNYLMDPEVSARISEITKFTNANQAATEFLPEDFQNNEILNMSDETIASTAFYIDVASVLTEYDHIYSEFKMQ